MPPRSPPLCCRCLLVVGVDAGVGVGSGHWPRPSQVLGPGPKSNSRATLPKLIPATPVQLQRQVRTLQQKTWEGDSFNPRQLTRCQATLLCARGLASAKTRAQPETARSPERARAPVLGSDNKPTKYKTISIGTEAHPQITVPAADKVFPPPAFQTRPQPRLVLANRPPFCAPLFKGKRTRPGTVPSVTTASVWSVWLSRES